MSYEYKAKMMKGAIQDAKDDYINATSEEDKEEYRFEIRQLENLKVLYEDAAKADEYEAKAIILDRVKEFATEPPFLLANNEHEDYELYAYDQILRLIEKYESGEYDA